jgi:hypothetical protein
MSAFKTPVQLAAEAIDQEHIPWAGHRQPDNWEGHARAALEAGVEEERTARVLFHTHDDNYALKRLASWDGLEGWQRAYWLCMARGLRAALLGEHTTE